MGNGGGIGVLRSDIEGVGSKDGQWVYTLKDHANNMTDIALTVDGRLAVSASNDGALKIWDLTIGQARPTIAGVASLNCCPVSLHGKIIVVGNEAGPVHSYGTGQI